MAKLYCGEFRFFGQSQKLSLMHIKDKLKAISVLKLICSPFNFKNRLEQTAKIIESFTPF